MNRILAVVFLAFVAHAGPASAQALLGEYGAACALLTSNNLSVALTQTIPANSMIVVTAASSNPFPIISPTLSDPTNGNYFVGTAGMGNSFVAPYFHYTTASLASGTMITFSQTGGTGTSACVTIDAFTEVANVTSVSSGPVANSGTSTTQSLTTGNAFATPNLVYMSVAYTGDPGTLSTAVGTQLTKTCGGTPQLCVAASFRTANDLGPFNQTVNSQNSVPWEASIESLQGTRIFADGFE